MTVVMRDKKVIATYRESIPPEMKRQLKAAGYAVKEMKENDDRLSGRCVCSI